MSLLERHCIQGNKERLIVNVMSIFGTEMFLPKNL